MVVVPSEAQIGGIAPPAESKLSAWQSLQSLGSSLDTSDAADMVGYLQLGKARVHEQGVPA